MDEAVIKYYRGLLKSGFKHTGSLEEPNIFLDSVGENLNICTQVGQDYLHLYIAVSDGRIAEICYLCTCDPAANVVIEVLCDLVKGKTLEEALELQAESFVKIIGSREEKVTKKIYGIIELLRRGIKRYRQR
jgi:NifU-like protein involved in Fe-S cluster formation